MNAKFATFVICVFSFFLGILFDQNIDLFKPTPIEMKSITIEKLFPAETTNINEFIVISTDGIGFVTRTRALFLGLDVDKTYCLGVRMDPYQPLIERNFGVGECR